MSEDRMIPVSEVMELLMENETLRSMCGLLPGQPIATARADLAKWKAIAAELAQCVDEYIELMSTELSCGSQKAEDALRAYRELEGK